jgi:hypothetical protein
MTCVVLGFDGLEFELVEEFSLRNLKQKAYCKLSLEDFPVPSTPLIWSSMLIGRPVKDLIKEFMRFPRSLRWGTSWKMRLIRKITPRRVRVFIGDKFLSRYSPNVNVAGYLREKKIPTIFDEVKSWTNGIPGYNIEKKEARGGARWVDALGNDEEERKILASLRKKHDARVRDLFEVLQKKGEYSLIFFYDNWLDIAGHIELGRKLKIMNKYLEVNSIVGKVKERLNIEGEDVLYVVSDHGMKLLGRRGDHSDYGFFSSSTGEMIQKPYELYHIMKKKLRGTSDPIK